VGEDITDIEFQEEVVVEVEDAVQTIQVHLEKGAEGEIWEHNMGSQVS
jgi:hypothetical protein